MLLRVYYSNVGVFRGEIRRGGWTIIFTPYACIASQCLVNDNPSLPGKRIFRKGEREKKKEKKNIHFQWYAAL